MSDKGDIELISQHGDITGDLCDCSVSISISVRASISFDDDATNSCVSLLRKKLEQYQKSAAFTTHYVAAGSCGNHFPGYRLRGDPS